MHTVLDLGAVSCRAICQSAAHHHALRLHAKRVPSPLQQRRVRIQVSPRSSAAGARHAQGVHARYAEQMRPPWERRPIVRASPSRASICAHAVHARSCSSFTGGTAGIIGGDHAPHRTTQLNSKLGLWAWQANRRRQACGQRGIHSGTVLFKTGEAYTPWWRGVSQVTSCNCTQVMCMPCVQVAAEHSLAAAAQSAAAAGSASLLVRTKNL